MTLFSKYSIPLVNLIEEQRFFLNKITARYVYENGQRTEQISGYLYTVTNIETFDQISIFVEQQKPLLPINKFESLRAEGGKIFVQFDEAIIRPYYSERTKQIEDSIRAKNVQQLQ